jgi:hypothetical protein
MTVPPAGLDRTPRQPRRTTSTKQSAHRAAKKNRFLCILNYGISGSAPPNCPTLAVFEAGVVVLGSFEPCVDGGTAYGRLARSGQPRGTCPKPRDGRGWRGPVPRVASHARDQQGKQEFDPPSPRGGDSGLFSRMSERFRGASWWGTSDSCDLLRSNGSSIRALLSESLLNGA